jgi:hypothetical protein
LLKIIFESKSEGRRKVGRPGLRWLDHVENDLRVTKDKRWRKMAQNREEWRPRFLKGHKAKEQASKQAIT